jgi:hypothetical protein
MMVLSRDFSEFLIALNDHGVDYLLVGGYAVAYHGYPRATKDMDIWVAPRRANAQRLVAALHAFGVPDSQIDPAWFIDPDSIFGIGNYPYRIEIFCAIPGVTFDDCAARKVVELIEGVNVPIIGLDDLKANKRATARSQDLADLDHLP